MTGDGTVAVREDVRNVMRGLDPNGFEAPGASFMRRIRGARVR